MKLTGIEALLNLPYKAEINIKDVAHEDIKEFSDYYGSNIDENSFFDSITFKRSEVKITLTSSPKVIYLF